MEPRKGSSTKPGSLVQNNLFLVLPPDWSTVSLRHPPFFCLQGVSWSLAQDPFLVLFLAWRPPRRPKAWQSRAKKSFLVEPPYWSTVALWHPPPFPAFWEPLGAWPKTLFSSLSWPGDFLGAPNPKPGSLVKNNLF